MKCPLCQRSIIWDGNPWRPFCSERCQITDLGTWAAEQYRIPGPALTMELPAPEAPEPDENSESA